MKQCSHRKLLQLFHHVLPHVDNPQVPTKTSTEKEILQICKLCLTLTFLLSKTWSIKQWSHTTLMQNEAKIGPVLTDALNQILLLSASAAHYHLSWKDGMINVLGHWHQEVHREQRCGKQLCLELPRFCNHNFPSAWMFFFFFSPGIKPKSIKDNKKL